MKKKHEYVTGILTEAKIEPLENFNFMNYLHFFPAKINSQTKVVLLYKKKMKMK